MPYTSIDTFWYAKHPLRWILLPFTLIYCMLTFFRRIYLQWFAQQQYPVPIIVVGNLTVGGVGKTPLVIALANQLQSRGLRVGIVSRGYGSTIKHYPHEVHRESDAALVGDEPLLLAKKTDCPVVIAPKRAKAIQYLLDNHQSQIIISDDGLQHYAMGRAVEIVVIDGLRGLGNGFCIPAGPLREGVGRLQQVDFIVVNGASSASTFPLESLKKPVYQMAFLPGQLTQLVSGKTVDVSELQGPIAAVAAIGHPKRFFTTLKGMGMVFKEYPFSDHHRFQLEDFSFKEKVVVMTEKDAVKCVSFATEQMYFLPIDVKIDDQFWDVLCSHNQLKGHV